MLPEAELFVRAEEMLVEVLGRIREQDADIGLPTFLDGAAPHATSRYPGSRPGTMARAVEQHALADARLVRELTGRDAPPAGPTPGGADVPALAVAACAAARAVGEREAVVRSVDGELPAWDHLLRATVERSLLAHYVAAHLGSPACPLPEELARPLCELTAADAARWRALGYFRDPMPLPEHVSWRDRFLLTAGHEPHPAGH